MSLLATPGGALVQERTQSAASGWAKAREILANGIASDGWKGARVDQAYDPNDHRDSFIPQGPLKHEMEVVYGHPNRLLLKRMMDFGDGTGEYPDDRRVEGVKIPFDTTTVAGSEMIAEMVVHSVRINSGLDAGFFAKPNR